LKVFDPRPGSVDRNAKRSKPDGTARTRSPAKGHIPGGRSFGLTDEEVWEAVREVAGEAAPAELDTAQCEAVAEALARKIEQKRGE
jgi:hypothetical protein